MWIQLSSLKLDSAFVNLILKEKKKYVEMRDILKVLCHSIMLS